MLGGDVELSAPEDYNLTQTVNGIQHDIETQTEYTGDIVLKNTEKGIYLILKLPFKAEINVNGRQKSLRYWTAYDFLFKTKIKQQCKNMKIEKINPLLELKLRELKNL